MTEWLDLIIVEEVVIAKADIPFFESCRMGKCRRGGVVEVHQVLLCGE
jgi:hypothetical protein